MIAMAQQERVPPDTSVASPHGLRWLGSHVQPAGSTRKTAFRLAATPRDRRDAFRLVYEKYLQQGMLEPNRYGLRVTEFHLLDATAVFIAEHDGRVIGTATLIGDGPAGLPLDAVYPEFLAHVRRRGLRVGEASSLAIRSPSNRTDLHVFLGLTRLIAQYARAQGMHQLLVAWIPEHAEFYRRFLGFEQIGHVRPYPMVCDTLGVACRLDFEKVERNRPDWYDACFEHGFRPEELISHPMSEFERDAYARLIGRAEQTGRRAA
jgi:hypothetical protein